MAAGLPWWSQHPLQQELEKEGDATSAYFSIRRPRVQPHVARRLPLRADNLQLLRPLMPALTCLDVQRCFRPRTRPAPNPHPTVSFSATDYPLRCEVGAAGAHPPRLGMGFSNQPGWSLSSAALGHRSGAGPCLKARVQGGSCINSPVVEVDLSLNNDQKRY